MAELTQLESKLGEVLGLAMAAQDAGRKIAKLVEEDDEGIARTLQRMVEEARQTQERSEAVAGEIEGKKTAILEKGRETKQKAAKMMDSYLDDESDGLDGLEFLTMAEAGELGHWRIFDTMSEKAGDARMQELAKAMLPIQEKHFAQTMEGSIKLACEEDPNETE